VVPGLLLVLIYSVGIWLMVRFRPHLIDTTVAERQDYSFRKISVVTLRAWGVGALIILVLGGMYGGFFTPTEAGGIGAFGALVLALVKRRLNWANIKTTLLETGHVTASIFFLLIAAQMYSRMIALSGVASYFSNFCASLALPPIIIIVFFLLIYIVLGTVLDSISMLLITIPLMIPVVRSFGFDAIWFGILCIVAIEMGLLTPPFGLVVFTMKAALADEASIEEIFWGSLPFLIMMIICLTILVAFPSLTLWLPNLGK
jgi:tripartite ATP-independent transporter DctM subunit